MLKHIVWRSTLAKTSADDTDRVNAYVNIIFFLCNALDESVSLNVLHFRGIKHLPVK